MPTLEDEVQSSIERSFATVVMREQGIACDSGDAALLCVSKEVPGHQSQHQARW